MICRSLFALTGLFSILLSQTLPVHAQQAPAQDTERIELLVGDIVEMIPVHTLPDAQYTWILTQDRTFLSADRSSVFRQRLSTPGTYTLFAEITAGGQETRISRTFLLDYKQRDPSLPTQQLQASGSDLVRTTPAARDGKMILNDNVQVLKLEPLNADIRPVSADLNTERDTDGDGNTANDIDSKDTLFQSDATPLYVWYASPITKQSLAITALKQDGATTQKIDVYTKTSAEQLGALDSPLEVSIQKIGDRSYQFEPIFTGGNSPRSDLLFSWNFGDGTESMLTSPTHDYTTNGSYEVMLRVRQLTDGSDFARFTQTVVVEGNVIVTSAASSQIVEPEEQPSGSGTSMGTVLLLGSIFVLSLLIGVGIIVLIGRLRGKGKSLSDTFEALEQNVLGENTPSSVNKPQTLTIAAPSAKVPPATIAERELDRPVDTSVQKQAPVIEEKNAPSWLKSGLTNQQQSPAAPVPPKPFVPVAATPVAPAKPSAPATPLPARVAPTPKPATPPPPVPTVTAQPSAPDAAPAPVAKPIIAPATSPRPAVPAAAPASQPTANVPAWLQQKPLTPTPTPAPVQSIPPTPSEQPPAVQPSPVSQAVQERPQIDTVPSIVPTMPKTVATVAIPTASIQTTPASAPQPRQDGQMPAAAMPRAVVQPPVTPSTVPSPTQSQSTTPTPSAPASLATPSAQPQSGDQPVAFIRADNLQNLQKQEGGQPEPPTQ